jgi:glucosamine--fructose-6-phosphate aminotransferase (isomerizing)
MADASWHTDDFPELRDGPPWVMQEMIDAQPELAEPILVDPSTAVAAIAEDIAAALDAGRPVTVVGCGTSEHGAHGVAALIAAAVAPGHRALVRARPSFAATLDPAAGLCLAVSHDGGTRATELAVKAARDAGARTAAITHDPTGTVATAAELVLVTPVHDASWCHTVAYTSALLAGAAIAALLGGGVVARPDAARDLLRAAIGVDAAPIAQRLGDRRVVLCAGAGLDLITARELALKIAEGARLPTIPLELETVLHGQLAGHEAADALVLVVLDDTSDPERLTRRATHVARAAAAIGLPVAALLSAAQAAGLPPELTPAGRLVLDLPDQSHLDRHVATLLAGAGALQALTLQLAHARAVNPDLIRREEAPYRAAAAAAEGASDW